MKSFHKTMGYLSAAFLLMIILSISISSTYMKNNNIGFPDLFAETGSLVYDSSNNLNFWASSKKSSSYETIKINESNNFKLVDELNIGLNQFKEQIYKESMYHYYLCTYVVCT